MHTLYLEQLFAGLFAKKKGVGLEANSHFYLGEGRITAGGCPQYGWPYSKGAVYAGKLSSWLNSSNHYAGNTTSHEVSTIKHCLMPLIILVFDLPFIPYSILLSS